MTKGKSDSAKAERSLTARPISDPTVQSGRVVVQRIKVTLGITGWSSPRVHIDRKVWHLDVGSSPLETVVCFKSWVVCPLKWHVSWVQNVTRQFNLYSVWVLEY